MADKHFKVKNNVQVSDLTTAGPVTVGANGVLESHTTLAIDKGGTGQTTAANAINALLPSQITATSKILGSDGTNVTWVNPGAAYQTSAPSNPALGQLWVDSDETGDSLDPYIIRRKTITATAGQTVFTTDVTFTDGYEQVYYNGVLLVRTTDYTTSGGTNTVTLLQGASAGDTVEIIASTPINLVNTATLSTNTFVGEQYITGGNLSIRSTAGEGLYLYRGAGNANDIRLHTSQGTISSPTIVTNGQLAGQIHFQAYDGASYQDRAMIGAIVDGPPSSGNIPTALRFLTGSTSLPDRMRITSSGKVLIGNTSTPADPYIMNISGAITMTQATDITPNSNGDGHFKINGNGYSTFISMDGTATWFGHNSSGRDIIFATDETARMRIDGSGNISLATGQQKVLIGASDHTSTAAPLSIRKPIDSGASTNYAIIINDPNTNTAGGTNLIGFSHNNNDYSAANVRAAIGATIDGSGQGHLVFRTGAYLGQSERMKLDSSGNLRIGAGATANGRLQVACSGNNAVLPTLGTIDNTTVSLFVANNDPLYGALHKSMANGNFYIQIQRIDGGAVAYDLLLQPSGGNVLIGYGSSNGGFKLQVNSQIFATSSSIATSDGRYKEEVNDITSGLSIINSLRPVSFKWKEHPVHNFVEGKTVGFIAQEVQEALSEYDWVDNIIKTNYSEEAEEEFLGIAEANIIPLLVAAVKELKSDFEEYKRTHP